MQYKVFINYILVKIGIRNVLPAYYIDKVVIEECNEKLVEVNCENIIFDEQINKPVFLRKSVYEKLLEFVNEVSKDGYKVKLYDAYRSLEEQKKSWQKRLKQTREEFPDYTEEQIMIATSLKVANPKDEKSVGGHQTGGAIDITLLKNEVEIDMGTKYAEYNLKTITKNELITKEQRCNRKYMKEKLEKIGFINFPAEWWHFCYGDRMWAAYKSKKKCFYGYIEPII